jgi:large subunit ribosomal protein L1
MAKLSKRMRTVRQQVEATKTYPIEEAVGLLAKLSSLKFKESLDVAINLGVDPRKSDQVVRSSTLLPNGTGKTVKVAVFAQGAQAEQAQQAGADIVGYDDLAAEISQGTINFDVLIATPDAMPVVGKLGQILGPRGLMPNPKVGTVTADVSTAVANAKAGQVRYRTDKNGIIHALVGRIDFQPAAIKANIEALLADLKKLKPTAAKGTYIKKVALSSTMGPGLTIDTASLEF